MSRKPDKALSRSDYVLITLTTIVMLLLAWWYRDLPEEPQEQAVRVLLVESACRVMQGDLLADTWSIKGCVLTAKRARHLNRGYLSVSDRDGGRLSIPTHSIVAAQWLAAAR